MEPLSWTISQVIEATGGDLLNNNAPEKFAGVSIDSRQIKPEELFVAIKGSNHDGHNFIKAVHRKGGRGFIIASDKIAKFSALNLATDDMTVVTVEDTTTALGDIARYNRQRVKHLPVVAITGSNGKTTTRTMTEGVLSRRFNTLVAQASFNNEIGVPLTLLRLNHRHEAAVLELGMNHAGEIRRLARLCQPDVGVITNIGPAHLEGLGSLENIAKAKGELLSEIKSSGVAVLNADDARINTLAQNTSTKTLMYGATASSAQIKAQGIETRENQTQFKLVLPSDEITVILNTPGAFMVSNALAAAAVGYFMGVPPVEIKKGLENFEPVHGRMRIFTTSGGIHVIDDTYNANPGSMQAAIKTLASLKQDQRAVLVMGDMLELGRHASKLHAQIGALIGRQKLSRLYITGEFASVVARNAHSEGLDASSIIIGSRTRIIEDLKSWLKPNDWVLIKGSRAMKMEKVVKAVESGTI